MATFDLNLKIEEVGCRPAGLRTIADPSTGDVVFGVAGAEVGRIRALQLAHAARITVDWTVDPVAIRVLDDDGKVVP